MTRFSRKGISRRPMACIAAGWILWVLVIARGAEPANTRDDLPSWASGPAASSTIAELESLAAAIEHEADRETLLARIRALIALHEIEDSPPSRDPSPIRLAPPGRLVQKTLEEILAGLRRHVAEWNDWLQGLASTGTSAFLRPDRLMGLAAMALGIGWAVLAEWLLAGILRGMEVLRPERGTSPAPSGRPSRAATRRVLTGILLLAVSWAFAFWAGELAGVGTFWIFMATAYMAARLVLISARTVLSPENASLRLVRVGSEAARSLYRGLRLGVWIGFGGYLVCSAMRLMGAPERVYRDSIGGFGLVLWGAVLLLILRNRTAVGEWIRGADGTATPPTSPMQRVRRLLAALWHIPAILYATGILWVWWLDIEGGVLLLVRGSVLTGLILLASRWALRRIRRTLQTWTPAESWKSDHPLVSARLTRYAALAYATARILLLLFAAAMILSAWGIEVQRLLAQMLSARAAERALGLSALLAGAFLAWEALDLGIAYWITTSEEKPSSPGNAARLRTLLPLGRKLLAVILVLMLGMTILAELGVNIGPLLAGAGIFGLAVGFGAQKLVQDFITGIFLLLEDAVAVGDVVHVAGIGGLVESLSIRSIRLRDLSGNVHTIPFSSVTTVTNMTRHFSYYLADVAVSYREDTDQVAAVCRAVIDEMRSDPEFAEDILEPLEVLGVDQFTDSAVILKVRVKTRPIRQWAVGREFNRRMKKRFDELGIEIPFPHRTLVFGSSEKKAAPG